MVKTEFTNGEKEKIESMYLYDHEWDWYGVEAITGGYLINEALNGKEIIKDFNIKLDAGYGFVINGLELIKGRGIYFPERFKRSIVPIFGVDHKNRVMNHWGYKDSANEEDRNDAYNLIDEVNGIRRPDFSLDKIKEENFLKRGSTFYKNFWEGLRRNYEILANIQREKGEFKEAELEQKLVDYYDQEIFNKL